MKRIFTFIGAALLMASAAQVQAQTNAFYPGLTAADSIRVYKAPRATTPLVIDGNPADAAWQLAPWKSAMGVTTLDADWTTAVDPAKPENGTPGTPVDKEGTFSGVADAGLKYKIVWDADRYYILFRLVDDQIVYTSKHNAYQLGKAPTYAALAADNPYRGAGTTTTALNGWRMDQLQFWLAQHTDALAAGTGSNYGRTNDGVYFCFYPGFVAPPNAGEPGVLATASHNTLEILPSTNPKTYETPQNHSFTSAITYNATEKAYYMEFRDTTWTNLFSNVRNKGVAWKATPYVPAVGHKFLMQAEYNDADGITNRRDYQLSLGWLYNIASRNPMNNLKQAITIELVETVPAGLNDAKVSTKLEIFPNPAVGNLINMNRVADVQIFSLSGHLMLESKNSAVINISNLKQGVYMVKDSQGNVNKLVRN